MADATTTATAGAEGAGSTTTTAPAAEGGEATTTETLPVEGGEETTASAEGTEGADGGGDQAEGGEETAPAAKDPPRVAAAKKMLREAEAAKADVAAQRADLDARETHLRSEVERVKGIIHEGWNDLQFGRELRAAAKSPAKVFALLQKELGVSAQVLAQGLVTGDDDDRPLTRRELREEQERLQREADAKKKTDEEGAAAAAKAKRDAEDRQFVDLARQRPATAKLFDALDDAAGPWVVKEGYKAAAARAGTTFTYLDLLADVEKAAVARLAKLGVAPAAPAAETTTTAAATGAKPVVGLSNRTAAATTRAGKAPLSLDERFDRAWDEVIPKAR